MNIISGLFNHGVLQRNRLGRSDALVTGRAPQGDLFWRAFPGGRWIRACRVARGAFRFRLAGLRTGGPYRLELEVRRGKERIDRLTVHDVLVGDVWICAGQSNMQGCGRSGKAAPARALVRAFYTDDRWAVAKDPIHNLWDCVDEAHIELAGGVRPSRNPEKGVGPAVAFGQSLLARTAVPQGLIACAHGGTTMKQWDPSLKSRKGRSLYGATVRRLAVNGGKIAGIIWYQGESDANSVDAAVYTERMKRLVKAFRRDAGNPRLPFVLVQLSRVVGAIGFDAAAWNSVQDQQRLLPGKISNLAVVPSIDLDLDDTIHIGGVAQHRLGKRLAQAMRSLQPGTKEKPPIALHSVTLRPGVSQGMSEIVVKFDHVEGHLSSAGRPTGFMLAEGSSEKPAIYAVTLERHRAILQSAYFPQELAGKALFYGRGLDPHGNVGDGADRSLPVFGPVRLPPCQAVTPFILAWQTASLSGVALSGLNAVPSPRRLSWQKREFPSPFCEIREERSRPDKNPKVVFFRYRFEARVKMRLALLFGYNRAVKLWVDGRLLCHDRSLTPLPRAEQQAIPFTASRGRHEVVVALDARSGYAWGLFLRFERRDLSPRLIARGDYDLPRIVT